MKANTVSGRPACWAQSLASRRVTVAFAGGPVVRVSWAKEARGSRAREGHMAGHPAESAPCPRGFLGAPRALAGRSRCQPPFRDGKPAISSFPRLHTAWGPPVCPAWSRRWRQTAAGSRRPNLASILVRSRQVWSVLWGELSLLLLPLPPALHLPPLHSLLYVRKQLFTVSPRGWRG